MRIARPRFARPRVAPPRPARPALWVALGALAAGAVLCVAGWYGVSGERFVARQVPYLASCTAPGAALIVAGTVLLTHGRDGLGAARTAELYELYELLGAVGADRRGEAGAAGGPAAPVPSSDTLLRVPGGSLWHRADCPLVEGKPHAVPVDATALAAGGLRPCPVCEPPDGSGDAGGAGTEAGDGAEGDAGPTGTGD
ncbi:hypothetical protein [Streptomyces beihaiensis]|uniref:Uncharacterized protein n=1 Tax=Streptomyces beihaiensis TaxID=2984495 RepID=A0ABT3TTY5_9ACTN|nr:hypothetical protein [Streptomyces beihaiensis]MCX3060489.1 hypothetical protein [Streptomyces beihaiensis]